MADDAQTVNGYRVSVGSEAFTVVPDDRDWEVEIGDVTLSVANNAVTIAPMEALSGISISAARVQKPNKMTDQPMFHAGKKGIICDGKRYCATNGCIMTPCGWLCG